MFLGSAEIFVEGSTVVVRLLDLGPFRTRTLLVRHWPQFGAAEGGLMAIATLSEVDTRIRDLVTRELEWDAAVDASAIGVTAKDRTVSLTGYVDTYLGKLAAERAAKRVRGVRAVANDIEVRPKIGRTDADIARDVVRSLELRSTVPDNVQATGARQ
jgi:hypothetical protein